MANNPFVEWPLWHYFTQHMQNAGLITDRLRLMDIGSIPVTLNSLENPSESLPAEARALMTDTAIAIRGSRYYDFMNDSFLPGTSLNPLTTYVVKNSAFNKQTIKMIPTNSYLIVKGLGRKVAAEPSTSETNVSTGYIVGGEIMPITGYPNDMTYIFEALGPAQAFAKGINVPKYDIFSQLTKQQADHVKGLLSRPIYQNATIKNILDSYKRQTSIPSDLERNFNRIKNQLLKPIPEEKAINVTSGALVNAVAPCYNVVELQVTTGANENKVVKFAYKTNLKEEERQAYEALLRNRFNARSVQAAEPSIEQRRAVSLVPIRASYADYDNLFRTGDNFQTYIKRINEITQAQTVDTSQTLHNEIQDIDEEENLEEFPNDQEEDNLEGL